MTDETKRKHIWAKTFTSIIGIMLVATLVFSSIVSALGEAFKNSPIYTYLSYGISSIALLCAIALVKFGFKAEMKSLFNRPEKKYIFALPLIAAGCFFAFSNLNVLFVKFLSLFGYVEPNSELPEFSPSTFAILFIVVCVLPAIMEEILFRGFIALDLSFLGVVRSALISALLFALYHLNPAKTLYQFVLGFIFSIVALKSRSIIPGMILHFLNNFVVLIICYAVPGWNGFTGVALIVSIIFGLLCLALGLYMVLKSSNESIDEYKDCKANNIGFVEGLLYLAPGLIVAVAVWITSLFVR